MNLKDLKNIYELKSLVVMFGEVTSVIKKDFSISQRSSGRYPLKYIVIVYILVYF